MATISVPPFSELTAAAASELEALKNALLTEVIAALRARADDLVRGVVVKVPVTGHEQLVIQYVMSAFQETGWRVEWTPAHDLEFSQGKVPSIDQLVRVEKHRQKVVFGEHLQRELANHVQAMAMGVPFTITLKQVLDEPWVSLKNPIVCAALALTEAVRVHVYRVYSIHGEHITYKKRSSC